MILKTIFIRFYKSFNFDYLRKHHKDSKPQKWEYIDEMWYPYVRVPIDSEVTTIVGANESGKSHLLSAIDKGVSGQRIVREDFCRYSHFFAVEKGKLKYPEFGFEWTNLEEKEKEVVEGACEIEQSFSFDSFLMFRTNQSPMTIYISQGDEFTEYNLTQEAADKITKYLPHIFTIDSEIALPDSVPIKQLAYPSTGSRLESLIRQQRIDLIDSFFEIGSYFADSETVVAQAKNISSRMSPLLSYSKDSATEKEIQKKQKEIDLARKLILNVAQIDPQSLLDLYSALREGKDGHANALIQRMNYHLSTRLNFPLWWVQDKTFELILSPREYDLVFTIRDRTETDYSFSERSSGLKYFLSYYVQYRSHEHLEGRQEIVLMDEPDAFLSSQAQQDLLKIFQAFATPDDGKPPIQVIYVTHSPFLIDKNHSERIRVLDKGVGEEGTRVVKNASKNHYEPLRSAFGAFVGETTFIGNCNLIVEGAADQILIAGAATHMRSKKVSKLETLDLNHVTIVPAGSAPHIPYMVYLARGRDVEQPAVVVLLDSDASGNDAKKKLLRNVLNGKMLLKKDFILQIGDLSNEITLSHLTKLVEIEDLIPLPICVEVVKRYAREICGADSSIIDQITQEAIIEKLSNENTLFDAIEECLEEKSSGESHIEKVGFARITIETVSRLSEDEGNINGLVDFENNMKIFFKRLYKIQRQAERELAEKQISNRIERIKSSFINDRPHGAKREEVYLLLDDLETALDDSDESDKIKHDISQLRRRFDLDENMNEPIANYQEFLTAIEAVKYAGVLSVQVPFSDELL